MINSDISSIVDDLRENLCQPCMNLALDIYLGDVVKLVTVTRDRINDLENQSLKQDFFSVIARACFLQLRDELRFSDISLAPYTVSDCRHDFEEFSTKTHQDPYGVMVDLTAKNHVFPGISLLCVVGVLSAGYRSLGEKTIELLYGLLQPLSYIPLVSAFDEDLRHDFYMDFVGDAVNSMKLAELYVNEVEEEQLILCRVLDNPLPLAEKVLDSIESLDFSSSDLAQFQGEYLLKMRARLVPVHGTVCDDVGILSACYELAELGFLLFVRNREASDQLKTP